MNKLKFLTFLFCVINPVFIQAQIIISEVNFDVPRSETPTYWEVNDRSHYGEFIELYNFTDTDISIAGWKLEDLAPEAFTFPANTVIKSRNFIVVAYKNNTINENPITSFYPSSIGHEPKIIYQNIIKLRNNRENVRLTTQSIAGLSLKRVYEITNVMYKTKENLVNYSNFPYFDIYNEYQNTTPINYANYPSINYNQLLGGYTINPPNPFVLQFPPPISVFSHTITDILDDHYNDITYQNNVLNIINNTCDKNVATIEQTPNLTLSTEKKCAVYDASGNLIDWTTCSSIIVNPPQEYTEDQLQQIDAAITVFPNPTTGAITAQWDVLYQGKIKLLHAATSAGNIFYTSPSLLSTTTTPVNLGSGSMGLYLITFVLDTNQIITRNVIKY